MAIDKDRPKSNEAMRRPDAESLLSEPLRMEIFRALVDAQDRQATVAGSREVIAQRYGITELRLRQIEDEGIEKQWPPLRAAGKVVPVRLLRSRPLRS